MKTIRPLLSLMAITIFLAFSTSCKKQITDPSEEPKEDAQVDLPIGLEISTTCEPIGDGQLYEVGPGKEYERIIDVPFESLGPGDVVAIHAKSEPYYERILLTESGTKEAPICICGIPDSEGNLPILDGTNARTRTVQMNEAVLGLGLIIFNLGNNHRWGEVPSHYEIKNLVVRGAHQYLKDGSQRYYKMDSDELLPYSEGAAGIRLQGENIKLINNIIEYNGNGLFGAFNEEAQRLRNIYLIGNIIRNNGTKDVFLQHNVYLEADSLISYGNVFGPTREGSLGANYKSRGAGDVIMYNRFVGPALRQLDLVESQNGYDYLAHKESFRTTWVVGNIVEGSDAGASNILHYGGDGDNQTPTDDLRQGTVYAYNNTFVIRGNKKTSWRKSFCDLNTCNEKLYAFNNLWYYENTKPSEGEDSEITIFRFSGSMTHFSHNILPPQMYQDGGAFNGWYSTKTNGDPCNTSYETDLISQAITTPSHVKFVDLAQNDLRLQQGSAAIDAGMAIPTGLLPLNYEFKYPNGVQPRKEDGKIDIGAFEF